VQIIMASHNGNKRNELRTFASHSTQPSLKNIRAAREYTARRIAWTQAMACCWPNSVARKLSVSGSLNSRITSASTSWMIDRSPSTSPITSAASGGRDAKNCCICGWLGLLLGIPASQRPTNSSMSWPGPLKALSEKEAEKWFPGITTVIRPGLIVGPGDESDRFTYWPVRLARGGDVLTPGDGKDPVQFVDARDLAEWTIRMVESRTLGVFNAMGPASELTMGGMLDGIQGGIGSTARLVWANADFLEQQKVSPWGDMPVWIPATGDTAGANRRRNQKAIAAGLTFRPLAETTADTLAWWKTLPAERQAKLRAGIAPEREAQVLEAWRAKKG